MNIGNTPNSMLRSNFDRLINAVTANLYSVTNAFYARKLITFETHNHVLTATGLSDLQKSSQLVTALQTQLAASTTPEQHLIDMCHVLLDQKDLTLRDIATSILHELGE